MKYIGSALPSSLCKAILPIPWGTVLIVGIFLSPFQIVACQFFDLDVMQQCRPNAAMAKAAFHIHLILFANYCDAKWGSSTWSCSCDRVLHGYRKSKQCPEHNTQRFVTEDKGRSSKAPKSHSPGSLGLKVQSTLHNLECSFQAVPPARGLQTKNVKHPKFVTLVVVVPGGNSVTKGQESMERSVVYSKTDVLKPWCRATNKLKRYSGQCWNSSIESWS